MATISIALADTVVPVVTTLLAAAALRLRSIALTVLAAYVLLVAEVTGLTLVLSPFRAVTRSGLAIVEEIVLACVLVMWWLRGHPLPDIRRTLPTLRRIARDPAALSLAALVFAALAYELVLVLTVPANNWDSLTYHLPRVASWAQHGGVYWIPHAPTDRMNEFQPVAEQQLLLLFVATHKGALFALPQFLAQLTIVTAIYLSARRLHFGAVPAAGAALLFATLPLVALEATTSQNDLAAASLPAAALALLLEGGAVASVLAGLAVALGLGVKLTTALVLPVLVVIALRAGRRSAMLASLGAVAGFVTLAMWGFVLNLVHTGHLLGHGEGRVENTTSPSWPGSLITLTKITYRLLDLSGFGHGFLEGATIAGVAVALLAVATHVRRRSTVGWGISLVLASLALSPILVRGSAAAIRHVVNGIVPDAVEAPNRRSSEDFSGFGPLGAIVLVAGIALALTSVTRRQRDAARLALAATLPGFLVILALTSRYNPWLSRFLIVPVALTMPLAAPLFRRRATALAIVAVAALCLGLTLPRNELKPLSSRFGRPWSLDRYHAVALTWKPATAAAERELDRSVPRRACVGLAVGSDDPSYVVFGPELSRRVVYLPLQGGVDAANRTDLRYAVVDTGTPAADSFAAAGWTIRRLASSKHLSWSLATRPGPERSSCT